MPKTEQYGVAIILLNKDSHINYNNNKYYTTCHVGMPWRLLGVYMTIILLFKHLRIMLVLFFTVRAHKYSLVRIIGTILENFKRTLILSTGPY